MSLIVTRTKLTNTKIQLLTWKKQGLLQRWQEMKCASYRWQDSQHDNGPGQRRWAAPRACYPLVAVGRLLALDGPKQVVFAAIHNIQNATLQRLAHHGRRDHAPCILRPSGKVLQGSALDSVAWHQFMATTNKPLSVEYPNLVFDRLFLAKRPVVAVVRSCLRESQGQCCKR